MDYLWLTPFYRSPQHDNGYDVSDYYSIDPAYGSMADFELLLAEARLRGIGVMLDIVVNHTSTDHPWFRQALQGRDNPYRDFTSGATSPITGAPSSAARRELGRPAASIICTCSIRLRHLNWDNPEVRRAVFEMMNFWADKGVAGFRLDVINLISRAGFLRGR